MQLGGNENCRYLLVFENDLKFHSNRAGPQKLSSHQLPMCRTLEAAHQELRLTQVLPGVESDPNGHGDEYVSDQSGILAKLLEFSGVMTVDK